MNHLVNHRLAGESFKAFRARRKATNAAVKKHLRGGKFNFISSEAVVLPMRTVDLAVDAQIEQGKLRDVRVVTPPQPLPWPFGPKVSTASTKQFRVGRTKGKTYRRYPEGRDRREWRIVEKMRDAH